MADVMAAEAGAARAGTGAGSAGTGAGSAGTGAGSALRVDGGASANDLLMQIQADQRQAPVERQADRRTALGAAFLAGLATGVWSSQAELAAPWRPDRRFEPGPREASAYARWRSAVERTKGWAR